MKMLKTILWLAGCAVVLAAGCQSTQSPNAMKAEAVFYPPSPDVPRIQFLKSISTSEDLKSDIKEAGGFEKFIVGSDIVKIVDWIEKPYGIDIHDGKIYVCDVARKRVVVLDLRNETFGSLTKDRRLANPVNIYVDDNGIKYVTDPSVGAVFVFGENDQLKVILGKDLDIEPIDVVVRGNRCYVSEKKHQQILVIDTVTGKEITRFGGKGEKDGEFGMITDLALDADENIYVTDKVWAKITKFDKDGVYIKTIGKIGSSVFDFIRPKGIDLDKSGRVWVIDAAPEVAKIYDAEGQLLMFFGFPGPDPGNMNLPASIIVDYDHVDFFKDYFSEGAQIEFLILVSNQYASKINVYGFGRFPLEEKRRTEEAKIDSTLEVEGETPTKAETVEEQQ